MFSSKIFAARRCRSALFGAAVKNFSPSTGNAGFFKNLKAKLRPNYKLTSSISDEKRLNEELLDIGIPRLFQLCTNVDYLRFVEKYDLPDVFHTWSKIVLLHIWMLNTRICRENEEFYREFRDDVVHLFWEDSRKRLNDVRSSRALTGITSKKINNYLANCHAFATILFHELDEGLLSNDAVFSSILWRNIMDKKEDYDLQQLAHLVEYLRFHVHALQQRSIEDVCKKGYKFSFL